jgi:hypothetical protein
LYLTILTGGAIMSAVVITTICDEQYTCSRLTTGPSFLAMLGVPRVILGKTIPWTDGTTRRSFVFIDLHTTDVDLAEFQELLLPNWQPFGRITKAGEEEPHHGLQKFYYC